MPTETKGRVLVTRVGLTTGHVLCRHCGFEAWHVTSKERQRSMRAVRQHLCERPSHVLDFEDSHQTTVEVVRRPSHGG